MGITNQPPDLLPGTLDLLILRTLTRGAQHGYGIADRIRLFRRRLQVGESSLYPAFQRRLVRRAGCGGAPVGLRQPHSSG